MTTLLSRTRGTAMTDERTGRASSPGGTAVGVPGRRRSVPHLFVGGLLVVLCTLGFAVIASRVDDRRVVLALARPVTVGQVLTSNDLRDVQVAAGGGVDTIDATSAGSVAGRSMAVSLPAGALLTRAELSTGATLADGQAVVAVLAKPGEFPPDLTAGTHVLLVPVSTSSTGSVTGGSLSSGWSGVVTDVAPLDNEQGAVVSVQLPTDQARLVAALPSGGVAVVLVGGS